MYGEGRAENREIVRMRCMEREGQMGNYGGTGGEELGCVGDSNEQMVFCCYNYL